MNCPRQLLIYSQYMYTPYQSPAQRAAIRQLQLDRFNANALARTYGKQLQPGNSARYLATLNPNYSNPLSGLSLTMEQILKRRAPASQIPQPQMSKRKAYSSAQFDAEFGPSVAVKRSKVTPLRVAAGLIKTAQFNKAASRQMALNKQIKALIQGKKRDAADVTRTTAAQSATTISCLTSSTDFATAASGTGILDMDGDSCLINSLSIRQDYELPAAAAASFVSLSNCIVRTIIAWFYKPLTVASAAGTLPPITEVLVSDSVASLPVQDTANAGRFTVLYDKTDNLGRNINITGSATYTSVSGTNRIMRDLKIPIGKKVQFKQNAQSGTPAGQFDSDVSAGQVDRGLLVMYVLVGGTTAGVPKISNITRLNYTG